MRILITLLSIKAIAMVFAILYAGIGLGPDEAQYWTWSQELDWGYYSKPPGIAWQIWLGTFLLGNTELGVRSLALVFGFALPLAVFWCAKNCHVKPAACLWAGIVMAFTPLGILGSLLAITDGGMILCWTIVCGMILRSISLQKAPSYLLLGAVIAIGALFKWPIYYLWLIVLASLPFYPMLKSPRLIYGVAISLLGLLPSLIWNYSHDFATWRHVFATIHNPAPSDGSTASSGGNPLEFLGAQAALLSPVLFGLLVLSYCGLFRASSQLKWCGWVSLVGFAGFAIMALFKKMQGNWAIFVYPTAIVWMCGMIAERKWGRQWLVGGTIVSVVLCALVISLPQIQSSEQFGRYISYKTNPFRHNVGWDRLSLNLMQHGYHPDEHFLFGDKYQMSSILSFYGPAQKRAYFFNLHGIRNNQFSYWPSMVDERVGSDGYFVLAENSPHLERDAEKRIRDYQQLLTPYFTKVEYLETVPLFMVNHKIVKGALIFRCSDYNGSFPPESSIY